MDHIHLPARMAPLLTFLDTLNAAAHESAVALQKVYHDATRQSRGGTLRPGPETPLWNELAALAASHLEKYGDKANLARTLGVPRQRVHEYLVSKTACPDTERALMLLGWVLNAENRKSTGQKSRTRRRRKTAASTAAQPESQGVSEAHANQTGPQRSEPESVTQYVTLIPPSLD